jgi:hypothetical protein
MADQTQNTVEIMANFEELSVLESEFEDVEIELSTAFHGLSLPLNC